MAETFKVWVHVERIDEEQDVYEDAALPDSLAEFDTYQEACEFVASLPTQEG